MTTFTQVFVSVIGLVALARRLHVVLSSSRVPFGSIAKYAVRIRSGGTAPQRTTP